MIFMVKRSRLSRSSGKPRSSRLDKVPAEVKAELNSTSVGVIAGISGQPMSGLWMLHFRDGSFAHLESGYGTRVLAQAFGATEGSGDLQSKIAGKKIAYTVDEFGIFTSFTPYGEFIQNLKGMGYYDFWKKLKGRC